MSTSTLTASLLEPVLRTISATVPFISSAELAIDCDLSLTDCETAESLLISFRIVSVPQSVSDKSQSIAKSAEEINGTVAEIVRNTGSNKEAVNVLVDMTGKFAL